MPTVYHYQKCPVKWHRPINIAVYYPKLTRNTMLKFVDTTPTLSIAIALDRSSSMNSHRDDVVRSINQQLESFKTEAARTGVKTDITIYTFADKVTMDIASVDSSLVRNIDNLSYVPNGNTALLDAIGIATTYLINRNTSRKLLLVITDGEENQSSTYTTYSVSQNTKAAVAAGNFTLAACVPMGATWRMEQLGFNKESVTEWERTTQSINRLTTQVSTANTSLFSSYAAGATRSACYFTPDVTNISPAVISTNLQNLTNNFKVEKVTQKEPIASFVARTTNMPYRVGSAFYQLTKKEKVQASKEILVRDKVGNIYGGDNARSLLRIPSGGNIELNPASSNDYEVYVKSTSHNRNLVPNTNVLLQK